MLKLHNWSYIWSYIIIVVISVFKKTRSILNNVFRRMFVWVIEILQYERINVSEEIDINKSN